MTRRRPLVDRVMERVQKTDRCWLWTGPINDGGYGVIGSGGRGGRTLRVHRVMYEHHFGPIPEGMHVDHVKKRGCTSRACVNPAHLEAVTQAENNRRAFEDHTHCPRGHRLPDKTDVGYSGRRKQCKTCKSEYDRKRYAMRGKR